MILVLNIINKQKAEWLLLRNKKIIYRLAFKLDFDKDQILSKLFVLLKKNKLSISKIKAFILLFQEGSLTQIKVSTATINALAWCSGAKVYADYNFRGELSDSLVKILSKLDKIKKFKALRVVYARKPEITISQKKHKFTIMK